MARALLRWAAVYENLALSENGFLFNTRTGHTFSLNTTGTWVLRMLIEEVPPAELPARLVEAFDVDPATATRDVELFLFRLRDMDLTADSADSSAVSSRSVGE